MLGGRHIHTKVLQTDMLLSTRSPYFYVTILIQDPCPTMHGHTMAEVRGG